MTSPANDPQDSGRQHNEHREAGASGDAPSLPALVRVSRVPFSVEHVEILQNAMVEADSITLAGLPLHLTDQSFEVFVRSASFWPGFIEHSEPLDPSLNPSLREIIAEEFNVWWSTLPLGELAALPTYTEPGEDNELPVTIPDSTSPEVKAFSDKYDMPMNSSGFSMPLPL